MARLQRPQYHRPLRPLVRRSAANDATTHPSKPSNKRDLASFIGGKFGDGLTPPGDIVIGDEDGVVVVPVARISETIERLTVVRAAEATLDSKVKAGLQVPDFFSVLMDAGRFAEIG